VEELHRSRCRLKVWAGDMTGAKSDAKLASVNFQARQVQLSKLPPPPEVKTLPSLLTRQARQVEVERQARQVDRARAPRQVEVELTPPPTKLPEATKSISVTKSPPLLATPEPTSPPREYGKPVTEAEMRDLNRRRSSMEAEMRDLNRRRSSMEEHVKLGLPAEYFDPAMPMDRDFAPAYYHRGIWRLQTEQFESVLADFDRAIALNPQFSLAHAARGEVLQRLKRSDEAMAALDQALKLDPTLAAARFSQGMLWLERGDAKQAESAFDDVLMIDPESIKALTERSKIRRSRQDIVGSTADDRRVKQVRDRWNLPL
jgi:lipoprotein NlpI